MPLPNKKRKDQQARQGRYLPAQAGWKAGGMNADEHRLRISTNLGSAFIMSRDAAEQPARSPRARSRGIGKRVRMWAVTNPGGAAFAPGGK